MARLASLYPGSAVLEGTIRGEPVSLPGRAGFDLDVERARARGAAGRARGRVRVTVEGLPEDGVPVVPWRRGDRLEVTGWLREPRDFATPGAPSRARELARHGVRTLLQVKAPPLVRLLEPARPGPLGRARAHIVRAIDLHVAGGRQPSGEAGAPGFEVVPDSRAAAVLRAVLVDDRALLDEESTRKLKQAGIIHILSISGLHVAIVGGAAYFLLAAAGERARCAGAGMALWSYALLAGLPAPAVRSAVMASLVLLGRALHRDLPGPNALALALLVGGVLEPGGARDPGFQMTYAAAAGLLLLAPPIGRALRARLPGFLAVALGMSLGAELAVLPVAMAHFGQVSLVGPIVNLAAVPLAALVVGSGFALALAALLHAGTAAVVGGLAALAVDGLFAVAEPRGIAWSWRVAPAPPALALLAAGGLALALGSFPARRALRLVPVLLLYGALVFPRPPAAPREGSTLHFLDVGQGDAALVEVEGGGTLLVDAGGLLRSRFDVGDRVVVPFLLGRGHRRIDLAVVTHAHPDHASGMLAVLRELEVRELWLGDDPPGDPLARALRELARARGTRVVDVRRGHEARLGRASLRVLNPEPGAPAPAQVENSRSVVLRLDLGETAALLTGDIHADAETRITAAAPPARADLLKVAHHGSRTSSDAAFLAAVAPRLAVISCGYENRFGHPDASVLERLAAARARVLRTDLDGTVTVEARAGGTRVVRTERARFASPGAPEGDRGTAHK